MACSFVIGLIAALCGSSGVLRPEFGELSRQVAPIERLIIREFSPVDLPTLVARAHMIVRVVVTDAKSSTVSGSIVTDYTVLILSVEKGASNLVGKTVEVRRPGGEVMFDGGKRVTAIEPDFPAFNLGDEYVLFLSSAVENRFSVQLGAQGAFKIEGGK